MAADQSNINERDFGYGLLRIIVLYQYVISQQRMWIISTVFNGFNQKLTIPNRVSGRRREQPTIRWENPDARYDNGAARSGVETVVGTAREQAREYGARRGRR